MRLIDAEHLMQKISRMLDYCQDNNLEDEMSALFQVGDAIIDCQTIDAVPVVRCKDCKRYVENREAVVTYCHRGLNDIYVKPNDFCSYGERKDGDG